MDYILSTAPMGHKTSTTVTVTCNELEVFAEAELAAFYRAVLDLHGQAIATMAANDWLQTFECADVDSRNPRQSLRKTTIAAVSKLLRKGDGVLSAQLSAICAHLTEPMHIGACCDFARTHAVIQGE